MAIQTDDIRERISGADLEIVRGGNGGVPAGLIPPVDDFHDFVATIVPYEAAGGLLASVAGVGFHLDGAAFTVQAVTEGIDSALQFRKVDAVEQGESLRLADTSVGGFPGNGE
jgi:hypothetical protein